MSFIKETSMAIEIKMPRLSQTTDEVRLMNWLVREGDTVQKGDPLCEVETDKVTMEVESFEGGTVLKLLKEADTVIDAGTVIALLGEKGEKVSVQAQKAGEGAAESSAGASKAAVRSAGLEGVEMDLFGADSSPGAPSVVSGDGVRATRLVRNIAQKRNIDLSRVRGTGPRGMIVKADLESYISTGDEGTAEKAARKAVTGAAAALTPHQRSVAHSLSRSSRETPHFYLKSSLICDRIVAWRNRHRDPNGKSVAVDSFFLFAVGRVLEEMPRLNGHYRDDSFIPHGSVDINIAIAAGDELYAPLLRNVQGKPLEDIDAELRELARKTRGNRLERDDMAQGSFTVTNLGMFMVDEFAAIINPPQSGILSVGRMKRELVIGPDDAMQIHTVAAMTGSFDHRIVNGNQGAAFMQRIQEILEGLDIP